MLNSYLEYVYPKIACFHQLNHVQYRYNVTSNITYSNFVDEIQTLVTNRIVRKIQISYLLLKMNVFTMFEANIEFRSSTALKLSTNIFTFKIGNQVVYYRILIIILTSYLFYYGFEKINEMLRFADFCAGKRLLLNLLDVFGLYLAFMSIFYLIKISGRNQLEFLVTFIHILINLI